MDGLDEIVSEFLVEANESLDSLDQDLMALEENPEDTDRIAGIFRTVHTIKGTSGFLAFSHLEKVTHVGENLLVSLRDGKFDLTNDIADGLLEMVDAVREILGNVEQTGAEGDVDYSSLIAKLGELKELHENDGSEVIQALETSNDNAAEAEADSEVDTNDPAADLVPAAEPSDTAPSTETSGPIVEAVSAVESKDAVSEKSAVAPDAESTKPSKSDARSQGRVDSSVRIDVELLDRLMNLVGELVLARNQIFQFGQSCEDTAMVAASHRLNLITTELQEGVMKTRMQPIRNAWNKLPRVCRDLSNSCGKKVNVVMEGAETELDKTVLEAIKDPLTHIVRNAIDHGIEKPDVRVKSGKCAEGTLKLRGFHEGGQVNIEISDDGAGINIERIKQKAIEKELVTEQQIASMSDRDITNLILLPGFSTAEKITNVSGRGVGMDVVKTNIERIGGTLDLQSTFGKGTTLRIKIPLTLAIVPALIVGCGEDRYAIPQVNLLELLRIDKNSSGGAIELIQDVPVYRLRGNLLPLIYLDEQLGVRERRTELEMTESETTNIVVLQAESRQFGLVVDSISDTQEIVVKPLGQHLKNIPLFAGSTIMGDGMVSLILDVIGLAQNGCMLTTNAQDHKVAIANNFTQDRLSTEDAWLIVDPGDGSRGAFLLSKVARLEEFKFEQIETSGSGFVVQYRDQIMPLVSLSANSPLDYLDGESNVNIQVVVYSTGNQNFGIVVGKIVDIVYHAIDDENIAQTAKSQIIQGKVTNVIDLDEFVQMSCPDLYFAAESTGCDSDLSHEPACV